VKVYRIGKWKYLEDLSGLGAKLYGGRWNREGLPVVYTSEHLSLAVLELLANQIRNLIDETYGYIQIEIPDDSSHFNIEANDLQADWRNGIYDPSTIKIGSTWLQDRSSLLLSVPSAVLMQETNILINPQHPHFQSVRITDRAALALDSRVGEEK